MPFLLEAAVVLATLVHPNHIVCLCLCHMLMGIHLLAAYLQLQVV
ncbi:RNA polymerase subunit sigma-70 [Vibrio cholerae]|nr:RNA polymerase subunit sigma-70 [Vibrio cholerae]MVB52920.1 RNA polymerase subunit sigma-70 [Vibrio cholerae]MVB75573.1 RNA polymerase subunit sigma-70 [Vibrio cholerae]MVB77343.1 RNA polymerase subunit sigma-70 [Vibrio cholerae]MVC36796.1 RNA polymerase subunit sigma-70 [Vibrio cholerae]